MKPLAATDAITPAFTRTHQLLFERPLNYGRIWKLCASSYLAYCGSLFIPYPLLLLLVPHDVLRSMPPFIWIFMCLPFAILLAIFYFGNRMEFVEFEMLVTCGRRIAPMWRRYGARTWPWILLKAATGTVLSIALAPAFIAFTHSMMARMGHFSWAPAAPGTPPDPAQFQALFGGIMAMYALIIGAMLILKLASTLLGDFVLPFYAIENISLGEALRKGFAVIRAQPLDTLFYVFLKYVLAVLGYVMLQFALGACMIPLMIVFGIGAFVVTVLASAGAFVHLLAIAGIVLAYVIVFLLLIAGFGYLLNLLSAYSIYYLGGRYPMLGDYLEPPPPSTPFTPPPVFPSPQESDDDDDGPSFPMDPALA